MYKVTKYEDDIINIEKIKKTSKTSISQIPKYDTASKTLKNSKTYNGKIPNYDTVEEINKEIKVYTESDHLEGKSEKVLKLYEELKNKILELDDFEIVPRKTYIAFKTNTNICDINIQRKSIKMFLNVRQGKMKNIIEGFVKSINQKGHFGNGDYYININEIEDIDMAIPYIKQSIKINM